MNITDLPERMQSKVVHEYGCWTWTGAVNSRGYGSVGIGDKKTALAHRRAYELLVGPIPDGLTIDHLCENKRCLNPQHMEIASRSENSRRQFFRGPGRRDSLFSPRIAP